MQRQKFAKHLYYGVFSKPLIINIFYLRIIAESKQELIELVIRKGMPFTTARSERGVKTI